MKTWAEFYPDVVPEVPGCPNPTIDHALRRAAQRFMADTLAWREWLAAITTNGEFEQFVSADKSTLVVHLLRATLDGNEIVVYTPDDMPTDWREGAAGFDIGIFSTNADAVQLVPVQDAGLELAIEAVLKPSNTATGVQDNIFDRYVQAIAAGAKADLLAKPSDWSNPQLAGYYAGQFQTDIDNVAAEVRSGFSRAPLRVRPSFF